MFELSQILPHRPPMILLSTVTHVDVENRSLTSQVTITSNDVFFESEKNGVSVVVGLEYMAQTIGCLVGIYDLSQNPPQKPRVGFVLGSRKIDNFIDTFQLGETYDIAVKEIFFDNAIASFECVIYDANKQIVSQGLLNAYRPDDIQDFMKGYA